MGVCNYSMLGSNVLRGADVYGFLRSILHYNQENASFGGWRINYAIHLLERPQATTGVHSTLDKNANMGTEYLWTIAWTSKLQMRDVNRLESQPVSR